MTMLEKFFDLDFNEEALLLFRIVDDYDSHYDTTPLKARIFADMGVDGVHYCIVPKENDATYENSPVYRISPMDFSEGTVIWTAKNFIDFIRIIVTLKDAWILPCLIGLSKEDFFVELEQHRWEFNNKSNEEKRIIEKATETIKIAFQVEEISDLYEYINESFINLANHINLKFSDPDIIENEKGHYCYK